MVLSEQRFVPTSLKGQSFCCMMGIWDYVISLSQDFMIQIFCINGFWLWKMLTMLTIRKWYWGKELRNLLREIFFPSNGVWLCCPGCATGTHRLKCSSCLSAFPTADQQVHTSAPDFDVQNLLCITLLELPLFWCYFTSNRFHFGICVCMFSCVCVCVPVWEGACAWVCASMLMSS